MGLLKNLFDIATKVASVAQQFSGEQQPQTKKPAPVTSTPARSYEPEHERTASEWRTYFREIIHSDFPFCEVRENVPVTDLVGNVSEEFQLYRTRPRQVYRAEWGEPYTFVLFKAGMPKGVVMLGDGHSHDAKVKYLIARMFAKKVGVPYINFYTQMPNERSYVVGRIRKFLA